MSKLEQYEDKWLTSVGKAFLCERVVVRGKDLHNDMGDWDWFTVHIYGITGRKFPEKEVKLLNHIWAYTSYPDPSIWPNNTAALAGSVRSTASLAMAAGLINSEATLFGHRPVKKTIGFFLSAIKKRNAGVSLEDIVEAEIEKNGGVIFGYGRPLAKIDERVPHTIKKIVELGFDHLEHYNLALEVNQYLKNTRKITMNIVALAGALGADFGFSPEEYHLFINLCFYAGQPPCYLDAISKPEGSFFPIRCESIVYSGKERKAW
tara:strand:+ start:501 stop:1289 length:789 start_codon:yes stop_codon:yes gene_type:complete